MESTPTVDIYENRTKEEWLGLVSTLGTLSLIIMPLPPFGLALPPHRPCHAPRSLTAVVCCFQVLPGHSKPLVADSCLRRHRHRQRSRPIHPPPREEEEAWCGVLARQGCRCFRGTDPAVCYLDGSARVAKRAVSMPDKLPLLSLWESLFERRGTRRRVPYQRLRKRLHRMHDRPHLHRRHTGQHAGVRCVREEQRRRRRRGKACGIDRYRRQPAR